MNIIRPSLFAYLSIGFVTAYAYDYAHKFSLTGLEQDLMQQHPYLARYDELSSKIDAIEKETKSNPLSKETINDWGLLNEERLLLYPYIGDALLKRKDYSLKSNTFAFFIAFNTFLLVAGLNFIGYGLSIRYDHDQKNVPPCKLIYDKDKQ